MADEEIPPPTDADLDAAGADWRHLLHTTEKGQIRSCAANALIIVRHHAELRGRLGLDARSGGMRWYVAPPWGGDPRSVHDSDAVELAVWLGESMGAVIGQAHLWAAICAEAQRCQRDEVREWLDGLAWDGVDRVDGWLPRYVHCEDSEYTRSVGSAWLVSAVARTYQPGCQADYMLVLEGAQGTRKTSVVRALAGDEWAAEISIADSKDSTLAVHGPWICDWGEMSGMSRAEVEAVKSFLTRRVDHIRPPYGRAVVDMPRRCIFAGTTNDSAWLSDATGGRRYWPIRTRGIDVLGVARVREQLWAEAVVMYRAGARWWLSREVEAIAAEEQADRYEGDSWEEQIQHSLSEGMYMSREHVTLGDLVTALGIPVQAQTTGLGRRISRIMMRLGWARARWRQGGMHVRGYARPGMESEPKQVEIPEVIRDSIDDW